MFSRNTKFFVLALVLVACGREKREVVLSDCPPPPTCDCSAVQAELDALKAKQLAKPAPVVEEIEYNNCTAEYAAQKDKVGLERYNQAKVEHDKEIKDVKDKVAKTESEAKQLPEPPVVLGAPPVVTDVLTSTLELVPNFDQKKCQVNWNSKPQDPIVHSDWRYAATDELANLKEHVVNLRNEPEGFQTDMSLTSFFVGGNDVLLSGNSPEEWRASADTLISVLAKGGAAMQWSVGVIMRLQPEDLGVTARQLKRLYTATKLDFVKLDKDVWAAAKKVKTEYPGYGEHMIESAMPAEYDFGPKAANADGYYKGLVLRYWRYNEAIKNGSGKAAVANLQKVLRGVASGMKVNLQ